jgi:hypothetical protein
MASSAQIFQFRSKFSEFTADVVSDSEIGNSLDIANLWVDQNRWSAKDYPMAVQLWAAHFLSLKLQQLASALLGGASFTDLYIRSISFGERHLVFAQRQEQGQEANAGPGEGMLDQTIYGQLYIQLRTRNIMAVATV